MDVGSFYDGFGDYLVPVEFFLALSVVGITMSVVGWQQVFILPGVIPKIFRLGRAEVRIFISLALFCVVVGLFFIIYVLVFVSATGTGLIGGAILFPLVLLVLVSSVLLLVIPRFVLNLPACSSGKKHGLSGFMAPY